MRIALGDSPIALSLLTEATLEASLVSTLTRLSAAHGDYQDAWVFGYNSLIWNLVISHTEAARVTVYGYHHDFYFYSHINRGTQDNPGLIPGLGRDGSCRGVALRVSCDRAEHEFRMLQRREMLTSTYLPRWLPTEINGRRILALTFAMNHAHEAHADRLPGERVVGYLRGAVGLYGPACECLQRTLIGLANNRLRDPYLDHLWSHLQVTNAANGPCATTDATDATYAAPLPDPYLSA